jgi:hypothetical protein
MSEFHLSTLRRGRLESQSSRCHADELSVVRDSLFVLLARHRPAVLFTFLG